MLCIAAGQTYNMFLSLMLCMCSLSRAIRKHNFAMVFINEDVFHPAAKYLLLIFSFFDNTQQAIFFVDCVLPNKKLPARDMNHQQYLLTYFLSSL